MVNDYFDDLDATHVDESNLSGSIFGGIEECAYYADYKWHDDAEPVDVDVSKLTVIDWDWAARKVAEACDCEMLRLGGAFASRECLAIAAYIEENVW